MKRLAPAVLVPLLALTACGADDSASSSGAGERLTVVTSFYPLQYAIEQIGGDRVEVVNLTKPGAEPHELELTPKDVLTVSKADATIYLKGFQPAVDDVIAEAGDASYDVARAARLDLEATDDGHDHSGEEHGHATDPHFWLDPTRYADVAEAIAAELSRIDPEHASDYTAGAKDLSDRLMTLDTDFAAGLKTCTHRDLVTSHAAFGYLAQRYDLRQEGITGITPEAEPSAAAMAEAVTHIKEHDVPTIYAETLLPRAVADTIAKEAGAQVMVLDPVEAITDQSAAHDYFGVMDANLATLVAGQDCS